MTPIKPTHVALIMDGNGRWAKKRLMPRSFGHREGSMALRRLVIDLVGAGVPYITVYAFSTENWSRPQAEVDALMGMIGEFFSSYIDELIENGVRVRFLGDLEKLPENARNACLLTQEKTKELEQLNLNIAINYGGRDEIARAARLIAQKAAKGEIDPGSISRKDIEEHLYTKGIPDVDLVIRTAGEFRLSGFMLYQCAYAEFYATDVLWPDFTIEDFNKALAAFGSRERRFGGLGADGKQQ